MWLKLRAGIPTASRNKDIIAVLKKGGEAADRRNYRLELMYERLTGQPYPRHVTPEMQLGLDHEDEAAAEYELATGELVDKCGFVLHPTIPMYGCSPDRLVGQDGLIEIKCPTPKTHLEWLSAGVIPVDHVPQMLGELACTGRQWVDFVSYYPQLPLFIRRYQRDDKLIAALEAEVIHFNGELESVLKALPPGPQPAAKLLDMSNPDEVQF